MNWRQFSLRSIDNSQLFNDAPWLLWNMIHLQALVLLEHKGKSHLCNSESSFSTECKSSFTKIACPCATASTPKLTVGFRKFPSNFSRHLEVWAGCSGAYHNLPSPLQERSVGWTVWPTCSMHFLIYVHLQFLPTVVHTVTLPPHNVDFRSHQWAPSLLCYNNAALTKMNADWMLTVMDYTTRAAFGSWIITRNKEKWKETSGCLIVAKDPERRILHCKNTSDLWQA